MEDKMCLAEGLVIPASFEKLGHNLNVAVIGGTGSGKTVSYTESKLTHTYTSSVVVPLAKIKIKKKFIKLFEDRGYKVVDMDFTNPEKCIVGYDPLDYVHSDSDVIQLARNLIGGNASASRTGEADPYWNESAISVLAAVIMLAIAEAEDMGLRATFGDVIRIYRKLKVDFSKVKVERVDFIDCIFKNCDLSNGSLTELSFLFMSGRKKGAELRKKCVFLHENAKCQK